ncbi:hypothetical protein B0H16DRAFT_1468658 [Mycena metata]|uniref:Uncharacterized protein n=1 Tax=Mycena metata TaxID=1033252 RepID=A0AAD7I0I5_9AGAR|nr:hypothetical protein B0H16DRAFT_1468658 [Mycena metata]
MPFSAAHSVDQDPNPAEHRVLSAGVTGRGFIHHIIGGLQRGLARGLVIETENIFQPQRPREYCGSKADRSTRAAGLKYYCLAGAYVAGGCGEHSLSQAPQPNLEISMGHRGLGSVAQLANALSTSSGRPRHLSLLTYIHTLKRARILLIANTPGLALNTLAATFALFVSEIAVYTAFGLLVVSGYITYKRRTLNLEAKINRQWSQELGATGRLTIQSVLGCCGYFSPFVEATVSATCYSRSILPGCKQQFLEVQEKALTRWYIVSFGLAPVHIAIMAAGLLCSNHVTYRFGKGMMPNAYRLSREASYYGAVCEMRGGAAHLCYGRRSRPSSHPPSPFFPSFTLFSSAFPRPPFEGARGTEGGRVDGVGAGGVADRAQWSRARVDCQLADQYGADAAAHIIANNSDNTGPRAQTHTRGSGLSGGGYAQMPPNPFSPNSTPAASTSDLNLAGPRPHEDGEEEGDGYSYGYGGVEEDEGGNSRREGESMQSRYYYTVGTNPPILGVYVLSRASGSGKPLP